METSPLSDDALSQSVSGRASSTDDERIAEIVPLSPPAHLIRFFPIQGTPTETLISRTRTKVKQILRGQSDRLLVVIGMDAFNRAIWNDVQAGMTPSRNIYGTKSIWGDNSQAMHTPPQLGAATAGLVGGIQEMYGGQPVLSPMHFVRPRSWAARWALWSA